MLYFGYIVDLWGMGFGGGERQKERILKVYDLWGDRYQNYK